MKKLSKEIKQNGVSVNAAKDKAQKQFSQSLLDDVQGGASGGRWLQWIKNH